METRANHVWVGAVTLALLALVLWLLIAVDGWLISLMAELIWFRFRLCAALDSAICAAHRTQARFLVAARLFMPDGEEPPASAQAVLASACEAGDWAGLTEQLAESRRVVAAAWRATFGEELEIER